MKFTISYHQEANPFISQFLNQNAKQLIPESSLVCAVERKVGTLYKSTSHDIIDYMFALYIAIYSILAA